MFLKGYLLKKYKLINQIFTINILRIIDTLIMFIIKKYSQNLFYLKNEYLLIGIYKHA